MKTLGYILVLIGVLAGGFTFLETLVFAESAPQQAAGAAMALAWVAIPYVLARAFEKLGEESFSQALEKRDRFYQQVKQQQAQQAQQAPRNLVKP